MFVFILLYNFVVDRSLYFWGKKMMMFVNLSIFISSFRFIVVCLIVLMYFVVVVWERYIVDVVGSCVMNYNLEVWKIYFFV